MTKFYCLRCKKATETVDEKENVTSNNRCQLVGECTVCGFYKFTFTNENFEIGHKSQKERAKAKAKRQTTSLKNKAKKLGLQILYADEETQKCVKKCLMKAK